MSALAGRAASNPTPTSTLACLGKLRPNSGRVSEFDPGGATVVHELCLGVSVRGGQLWSRLGSVGVGMNVPKKGGRRPSGWGWAWWHMGHLGLGTVVDEVAGGGLWQKGRLGSWAVVD